MESITKLDKTLFADDGEKRGPLTMSRLRYHPREPKLLAQVADRRPACFDLNAKPTGKAKGKGEHIVGQLVCSHEIGWVRAIAVHPSGEVVITGGSDRTLRRWAWTDAEPAAEPSQRIDDAHAGWVESVAYSPSGDLIVSTGADKLVRVWDAADLKPRGKLTGHTGFVLDAVFARNGTSFATAGEDGKILVWHAKTLEQIRVIDFGGTNKQFGQTPSHSGVHRLSLSHDDRWLAAAGGEGCKVFDLETGELVAFEKASMDVAFHPSADLIAIGESEVRFWAYDSGKFAAVELNKPGQPVKMPPISGKLIAAVKRGDWSLGIDFSADGKQVALGKSDGTIELHEVA